MWGTSIDARMQAGTCHQCRFCSTISVITLHPVQLAASEGAGERLCSAARPSATTGPPGTPRQPVARAAVRSGAHVAGSPWAKTTFRVRDQPTRGRGRQTRPQVPAKTSARGWSPTSTAAPSRRPGGSTQGAGWRAAPPLASVFRLHQYSANADTSKRSYHACSASWTWRACGRAAH